MQIGKMFKMEGAIPPTDDYLDVMLCSYTLQNKGRVRFATSDMNSIHLFTQLERIGKYLMFLLSIGLITAIIVYLFIMIHSRIIVKGLEEEKVKNEKQLQDRSKNAFGMDPEDLEKVIQIGMVKEVLDRYRRNPVEEFQTLQTMTTNKFLMRKIIWRIDDFTPNKLTPYLKTKILYDGALVDSSGQFATLVSNRSSMDILIRLKYVDSDLDMMKLPATVPATQKYNTYPFSLEIIDKDKGGN
jgi:hypothetical protein